MKHDWLKDILGDTYTDELDGQVATALGKLFVSREDFNAKNTRLKELEGQAAQSQTVDADALNQQIAALQAQLAQAKIDAALQAALLGAKVTDVDYLAFKIREKGDIQLTEDGKIKGIDETLAGLKTQYPQFFTAESKKKIEENKLPEGEPGGTMTKEQFSKLGYQDRNKLFRDDPETYKNMMKE